MLGTIFFTLILVLQTESSNEANFGDSVVIFNLEASKITAGHAITIKTMLRDELAKLIPVLSNESLEEIGISNTTTFSEAGQQCKKLKIAGLVGGKIKKVANRYSIRLIYQDFVKGTSDTIATVNTDPLVATQLLAKSIARIKQGAEELEFGSIRIESQPSGAKVLLDGEYVGITPTKTDLIQFGEHSILLSKRGYNTAIKLIVVYPGKIASVTQKLEPITGTLIAPTDKMPVYLLEEVVVRGEKIKDRLFELPKGVDIISRREIEFSGAKDVPTLLSQVAGLSVVDPTGSGTVSSVRIRGMDPSKYTTVTIDGVAINDLEGRVNWNTIPIELVRRIEIIKSAPSEYGGQAAGGVINIITKEKEKSKILLSTANGKDIGGSVTLSVADVWSVWVNTGGRKGNGWRQNDKYDIRNVYAKSNFPLDKYSNITLSCELQDNNITVPGGISETEITSNPDTSGKDVEKKYQQSIRLTSSYGAETKNYRFGLNFNVMPQIYESTLPWSKHRMEGANVSGNINYEKDNFSLTTNIGWEFNRRHLTDEGISSDDNAQLLNPRFLMEWKENFYSVTLMPGISGEWLGYWFQETNIEPHYASILTPKLGMIGGSQLFDIFASFEKALRLPKPYEKVRNLQLSPEVLSVTEIGIRVKSSVFTFSTSAFYIRIENQILAEENTFVNHGDAFHRGIEGQVDLKLTDMLSLFSNYTTLEAKSLVAEDTSYWVPGIPIQETEIGLKISKLPVYSLTGSYNWKGKSFIDYENKFGSVPSYGIFDLTSKFSIRSALSLSIGVTNILNEEGKNFGYKLENEAKYYPISPRGVRAELGLEF